MAIGECNMDSLNEIFNDSKMARRLPKLKSSFSWQGNFNHGYPEVDDMNGKRNKESTNG
jgi:hypothetical protein